MKYVNKQVHFKLYSEENNGVEKFIVVIIMEWMLVLFNKDKLFNITNKDCISCINLNKYIYGNTSNKCKWFQQQKSAV